MLKKTDLAYFTPAGPLVYLLMDDEGNSILGLYHNIKDNKLVIIGNCYGTKIVFYPSEPQLTDLMQDKITLNALLQCTPFTTTGKDEPDMMQKILIRYWIIKEFTGLLSAQGKSITYPNYYYVFQEYMDHINHFIKQ